MCNMHYTRKYAAFYNTYNCTIIVKVIHFPVREGEGTVVVLPSRAKSPALYLQELF